MNKKKKEGTRGTYRKTRYIPEEQRRKDILEAARQVFGEKGFHRARIEEIAVRAGVAHGTIYRYYPSKAALATEIIGSRGASGFLESVKEGSLLDADPAELLKNVAKKYYGNMDERVPLMRFRIAEAVSNPDLGRNYYRSLLHRLCTDLDRIVREYQRRGDFKAGDPFIFGHAFYGILFGFLYCQELMRGKELTGLDLEKIIPHIVDIFLHGVSAPPTKPPKKVRCFTPSKKDKT